MKYVAATATVSAEAVRDARTYYVVVCDGFSLDDEVQDGTKLFETLEDARSFMDTNLLTAYDEVEIYKILALPYAKYRAGWTRVDS